MLRFRCKHTSRLIVTIGLLMFPLVPAVAETTTEILIKNSGGSIGQLEIVGTICNQSRFGPKFFAANDGKKVEGFCVRDAARLVTDLEVRVTPIPGRLSTSLS
jgi:hypothetical protein